MIGTIFYFIVDGLIPVFKLVIFCIFFILMCALVCSGGFTFSLVLNAELPLLARIGSGAYTFIWIVCLGHLYKADWWT